MAGIKGGGGFVLFTSDLAIQDVFKVSISVCKKWKNYSLIVAQHKLVASEKQDH